MKPLSEIDLAYLAGIVDGEGAIFVSEAGYRKSLQLHLSIATTSAELVCWLEEIGFMVTGPYLYGRSKREVYTANLTQFDAQKLLELLTPLLRIKKKQAEVAQRFVMRGRVGRFQYTDEEELQRILTRIQLRKLNGTHKEILCDQ